MVCSTALAIIISFPTSESGIIILKGLVENYAKWKICLKFFFRQKCLNFRMWPSNNYCYFKNNQETSLDLDDFASKNNQNYNIIGSISATPSGLAFLLFGVSVGSFPQQRLVIEPIFLRHGIMSHIPWPPSQSNPWNCIIRWSSF